jgi:hypothetical protein
VSENVVPRRIFVPKREEITGGLRKLYVEELSLFPSSNILIIRTWNVGLEKYVSLWER